MDDRAILAVTRGGTTPRLLSMRRPGAPIFAATDRDAMARRLALYWGVTAVVAESGEDLDASGAKVAEELVTRGLVRPGAVAVLVSVNPDLTRDNCNYLRIRRL